MSASTHKRTRKHRHPVNENNLLAATFLNALILIVISIFLLEEAWQRWQEPEPVNPAIMLVVAMVGLLANVYALIMLQRDAGKSIKVKAAWMLTDSEIHMEAHVELKNDLPLSEVKNIQRDIEQVLKKKQKIQHLTLQFEYMADHAPGLIHSN